MRTTKIFFSAVAVFAFEVDRRGLRWALQARALSQSGETLMSEHPGALEGEGQGGWIREVITTTPMLLRGILLWLPLASSYMRSLLVLWSQLSIPRSQGGRTDLKYEKVQLG